jgi:zinc transporter ZupT
MTAFLYVAVILLVIGLLGYLLIGVDASRLAQSLRLVGPLVLGLMGGGLMLIGRFAAGAMIFVVAEELIPEAKRGSPDIAALALMVGFAVMMTLDVALS